MFKLATGCLYQSKFYHLEHIFFPQMLFSLHALFPLRLLLLPSLPMFTQICSLLGNTTVCFSLLYSFFFQNFGLNISIPLKTQKTTLFSNDMNTFFLAAFSVEKKKPSTYRRHRISGAIGKITGRLLVGNRHRHSN